MSKGPLPRQQYLVQGVTPVLNMPTNRPIAPERKVELHGLSIRAPEYVIRQLKMRAAQNDETIKEIVLKGLRAIGITVHDEDMKDPHRRRSRI